MEWLSYFRNSNIAYRKRTVAVKIIQPTMKKISFISFSETILAVEL